MTQDYPKFAETAAIIANEAGTYIKSRFATEVCIEFKGEINLVTDVDKAAELMIIAALRQRYPEHDILTEEGQAERKDSPYKWIIDPLDGTVNFAHGYPLFAVSIALEHDGRIVAGAVYDPLKDEMFTAARGFGAQLNGKTIRVSRHEKLIHAMIATGFSYTFKQNRDNSLDLFTGVIHRAQAVRRDGVAAIDLCYVANGRYDGFWELNLFPWDVSAGVLIVEEAGGLVTRFDGGSFNVYDKEILATNKLVHGEMREVLIGR